MIPLQNSDANSKKISDSKQINEEVTKNEGQDNSFEIIPSCDNFASWQSPHQTASPQRLVMICDGNGCISGLESTSPPRHARRQVIIIEDDDPEQQKKSQQANLPEINQRVSAQTLKLISLVNCKSYNSNKWFTRYSNHNQKANDFKEQEKENSTIPFYHRSIQPTQYLPQQYLCRRQQPKPLKKIPIIEHGIVSITYVKPQKEICSSSPEECSTNSIAQRDYSAQTDHVSVNSSVTDFTQATTLRQQQEAQMHINFEEVVI